MKDVLGHGSNAHGEGAAARKSGGDRASNPHTNPADKAEWDRGFRQASRSGASAWQPLSGMHSAGIIAAVPDKQTAPRVPLKAGDEYVSGKDRFKIKAMDWPAKLSVFGHLSPAERDEHVLAHRFIRTTQKFSGNAYVERLPK